MSAKPYMVRVDETCHRCGGEMYRNYGGYGDFHCPKCMRAHFEALERAFDREAPAT